MKAICILCLIFSCTAASGAEWKHPNEVAAHIEAGSESAHYLELTYTLLQEGKAGEAEIVCRGALASGVPAGPTTVRGLLLNSLGEACRRQGRLLEARQHYDEALAILHSVPGTDAERNAVQENIAALLVQQHRYRDAETATLAVLHTQEQLTGAGSFETVNIYSNLSALYRSAGNCARAESAARRALSICQSKPGAARGDCLPALNNLGAAYYCERRYAAASDAWRRVVDDMATSRQFDGAASFSALSNLAAVLAVQGLSQEAEEMYRQALDRAALETDPEELRNTLNRYARLLKHMHRKREAQSIEARAKKPPAIRQTVDVMELSRKWDLSPVPERQE